MLFTTFIIKKPVVSGSAMTTVVGHTTFSADRSNKMAVAAESQWQSLLSRNPLEIVLGVKNTICVLYYLQQGEYLEDKMAGSN